MALETVGAKLTLKERRQFTADAQRAKRDIKELGDEAEKSGKKAAKAAGGGTYSGGFGLLRKTLGFVATGAKVALGVVGAVGAAGVALAVKTRASMEQAEIGFTTMLGSGDKAKSFMMDLRKFAETTPFQLPDVVTASQRLLAYGFAAKEILPTLTSVGDASAALGLGAEGIDRITTALGQIKAKGTVQAEEMRQLAEAGIPAWDMLAKKLGVTIPQAMKMVQARAVSSTVGISALTEGINQRFGGLMEKQSHTILGIWSNIVDKVRNSLGDAVLPFQDDLKHAETWVLGFADRVFTEFPKIAENIRAQIPGMWSALQGGDAAGVAQGFDAIFGGTGKLVPIVTKLVQAGMDLWVLFRDGIGPAFATIGQLVPLSTLQIAADLLHILAVNAKDLQPLLVLLIGSWLLFRIAMLGANTVIRINSALVGENGAVTVLARARLILFGNAAEGAAASTGLFNLALLANPITWLVLLLVILALELAYVATHFDQFKRGVTRSWDAIKSGADKAYWFVTDKINGIIDFITGLPGRIDRGARGAFRGLHNAFAETVNGILDWWDRLDFTLDFPTVDTPFGSVGGWSFTIGTPDIGYRVPMLAAGAIVHATPHGTLAVLGEGGRDEMVVPLTKPGEVEPILDRSQLSSAGGGVDTVEVPVTLDGKVLTRVVVTGIRDRVARR